MMPPPSFLDLVEEYLTFRRGLGFALESRSWMLRDFGRYSDRTGHQGSLTIDLQMQWALSTQSSDPAHAAVRLSTIRRFAQHRALADPATGGSMANGARSVYVQFGDGAGTWSAVQSASIVLDTVKPEVTLPHSQFVLSGTDVRIRLTWSGSDATSGIIRYNLERCSLEVGGPCNRVPRWSPTATTAIDAGNFGNTRYRLRAVDGAGNQGDWRYLEPGLHVDGDPITSAYYWVDPWDVEWSWSFFGPFVRYSTVAGAEMRFWKSAREMVLVSTLGPDRGEAKIYVDGVFVKKLDLYAPTLTFRQIVYAQRWPSVASHRLRIVVVGTPGRPRVDVDGFAWLGTEREYVP